jgi:hypothetical protein
MSKVVCRLIDDDEKYPWGVFVDGELVHRDSNRASVWAWADQERRRLANTRTAQQEGK